MAPFETLETRARRIEPGSTDPAGTRRGTPRLDVAAPAAPTVSKFMAPEILYGCGALHEVGHSAGRLGGRRPLLVTDDGVLAAGWPARAVGFLDAVGLTTTVWAGVTPNPKHHEIEAGAELYLERGCDVIVALGGGSCIDAAKGIAVVVSNGGRILDYEGIDRVTRPIPPLVALPTTAGTGADLSQFAIVTDVARRVKVTLIGRALVPDISITDPRLLTTMPDWLAATTGLDALTHGVESFVSRAANFLTDRHALAAITLVRQHLIRSVERPKDLAAREGMAQASMSAGLAFSNAILGATHAISHQLGGALDLPHGVLNAVLLPHVIRFNAESHPERFTPVATALGLDTGGPAVDTAARTADVVADFASYLGAPRRLRDLGVQADQLPSYAVTALQDVCITTNPRPLSADEVLALLRAAY